MKICVITPDYPDKDRPGWAFVEQLVEEFVTQGHDCCVIAPYSLTGNRKKYKFIEEQKIKTSRLVILRPNYVSLSYLHIGKLQITVLLHH